GVGGRRWLILGVVPGGAVAPSLRAGLSRVYFWRECRGLVCRWIRRVRIRYDDNGRAGQPSNAQRRRGIDRRRPRPRMLRQRPLLQSFLGLGWLVGALRS